MPELAVSDTGRPTASIIVEWENALHAAADRSSTMLRAVRRQAEQLAARATAAAAPAEGPLFELIVAHDPAVFPAVDLAARLARDLPPGDAVLAWRLQPVPGGGYYTSKNVAAAHATGDVLVFLDSDVVPEPAWLERLLGALDLPAADVAAGNTYIAPEGVVGKTFALVWFFPLRSEDGPARRTTSLFANNLAIRRGLFARHPFPQIPGSSRGACLQLADELERAGVAVFGVAEARAAHPAPRGFAHVSLRALAQGRDRVLRERASGRGAAASWPASVVRLLRHAAGSAWRIVAGFPRVGLSPLAVPAALVVATYYYGMYWVGETLTHLRVPAIRRIRI